MTGYRNAALALILCSACSSSNIQKVGSQYVKTLTVGPSGGKLTVAESDAPGMGIAGTSITIPAGALSTATLIQIGVSSQPVVSAGALGPVIDFEPSRLAFATAASVTIPVTLNGLNPSRVGVMAVEADGTSHDITAVTVASGLATFSVSGFTHYGCHDEGGDDGDGGGTCTPHCGDDAACGASDGCGGTCDRNCGDADSGCTPHCGDDAACGASNGCGGVCDHNCDGGGCTPTCGGDATCGSSDGCGGSCDHNCDGGGCTPTCGDDAACGASNGCGGICDRNCVSDAGCREICMSDAGMDHCYTSCDDGGECTPSCALNAACASSDGCGGLCEENCTRDGGTLDCDGDAGETVCPSSSGTNYCANLSNDQDNCGYCGTLCGQPNHVCVGGQCACADGLTLCGDQDAGVPSFCTDTTQRIEDCGACGYNCLDNYGANSGCHFGQCTCSPGQTHLCGTPGAGAACVSDDISCDSDGGNSGDTDGGDDGGGDGDGGR